MNSARATFDYSDLNCYYYYTIVSFASSTKKKPFKSKSLWTILHIACFVGLFQIKIKVGFFGLLTTSYDFSLTIPVKSAMFCQ